MSNPFDHHRRGSVTPQRRARIFAAADGKCHVCTRTIGPADYWEVEHVTALERGGTDEDGNLAPVCEWCHKPKTADDHAESGRMRRSYTRHVVPREYRKGRGWR